MDHDRKFLDTFTLVIGALIAFTVAMYFLANKLASDYIDTDNSENEFAIERAGERLAPVADVRTSNNPPPAAPVKVAATVTTNEETKAIDGQAIYQQACFACHGTGAAGAPKLGDKADWGPRIAKGMDTLVKHALEGFQGEKGFMPAKGGRTDLSDAEVKAALEYMVNQAK